MPTDPSEEILKQLQAITTHLERLALNEADRVAEQDRKFQDLDQRVSELERERHRSSHKTFSATAAPTVSPQQVTLPRRSRRKGARPIVENFVIGDKVFLLDQKQESTPYGVIKGFTRVGWAKIQLENGNQTIRKTNNITTKLVKPLN